MFVLQNVMNIERPWKKLGVRVIIVRNKKHSIFGDEVFQWSKNFKILKYRPPKYLFPLGIESFDPEFSCFIFEAVIF